MPVIDLVDDTFVAAAPERVADAVRDGARWRTWWPDLDLVVSRDRGPKGVQWVVRGSREVSRRRGGPPGGGGGRPGWAGTAEIWLEPWGDGVLLHHYLRLDPVATGSGPAAPPTDLPARAADAERRRRAVAWKAHVHALKDELERGRRTGGPAAP